MLSFMKLLAFVYSLKIEEEPGGYYFRVPIAVKRQHVCRNSYNENVQLGGLLTVSEAKSIVMLFVLVCFAFRALWRHYISLESSWTVYMSVSITQIYLLDLMKPIRTEQCGIYIFTPWYSIHSGHCDKWTSMASEEGVFEQHYANLPPTPKKRVEIPLSQ